MQKFFKQRSLGSYFVGKASSKEHKRLTVLTYHYVTNNAVRKLPEAGYTISCQQFEREVDFLLAKGFKPISIHDLLEGVDSNTENNKLPDKPLLVCFDGGVASWHQELLPILKRKNIQSVFLVVSSWVNRKKNIEFSYEYINAKQLNELLQPFNEMQNEIASHSVSHADVYSKINWNESEIKVELRDSKNSLEEITGKKIRLFALPMGAVYYEDEFLELAKQSGYCLVRTTSPRKTALLNNIPFYLGNDYEAKPALTNMRLLFAIRRWESSLLTNYLIWLLGQIDGMIAMSIKVGPIVTFRYYFYIKLLRPLIRVFHG